VRVEFELHPFRVHEDGVEHPLPGALPRAFEWQAFSLPFILTQGNGTLPKDWRIRGARPPHPRAGFFQSRITMDWPAWLTIA
ncbi:MAG: hypothetical protein V1755_06935, partial [Chloroflexota bacterium]